MGKNDIPTWGLVLMLTSGLIGIYFMARDLMGRFS